MFYIVRVWEPDGICDYQYSRQEEAQHHLETTEFHAEMFVWLDGREWYFDSNGR